MSITETDDKPLVLRTREGNYSVKVRGEDGNPKTLHSLYKPMEEAKRLVSEFECQRGGIIVVIGLALGYHVVELLGKYPDSVLVVVEKSEELRLLSEEYNPLSELYERLYFITGLSPKRVIEEITRVQIKNAFSPISLFVYPPSVSAFPGYYNPIIKRLKTAVTFRLWEKLRYPKFRKETLTVALMDYDYFLAHEIGRALERLGHRVVKIKGDLKREHAGDVIKKLLEIIATSRPDMLITVNHIGFDEEGIVGGFLESIEIPVASWYVDSPGMIVKAFRTNARENIVVFTWEREYMGLLREIGFKRVHYLPLATDEGIFRPIKMDKNAIRRWKGDVGFVGNSMVKSTGEYMERLSDDIREMAERVASFILSGHSMGRFSFERAVNMLPEEERKKIGKLSEKEFSEFETASFRKATLLYRRSCLEKLGEFQTVIHGDRGWREILNGRGNYLIRPELNYYRELPLFYNACKVNFNTTSLQMPEAVNQRVFDVPACRGFLITDHQSAVEELFEPGREVITYREVEEIPELVGFYLGNERARKEIAGRAHERVLKEHTYVHRVQRMIDILKEAFRN